MAPVLLRLVVGCASVLDRWKAASFSRVQRLRGRRYCRRRPTGEKAMEVRNLLISLSAEPWIVKMHSCKTCSFAGKVYSTFSILPRASLQDYDWIVIPAYHQSTCDFYALHCKTIPISSCQACSFMAFHSAWCADAWIWSEKFSDTSLCSSPFE